MNTNNPQFDIIKSSILQNMKKDDVDSPCRHPQFIAYKCTKCNKLIFNCGDPSTTPFSYIIPDLRLTDLEIKRLRDENLVSILQRKKLNLLLDLDNTLVHARMLSTQLNESDREKIYSKDSEAGFGDDLGEAMGGYYLIKLRPGARAFIEIASTMFDLSIFTKASRQYALDVANLLDSSMFANVISKENCTNYMLKGLDVVLAHERVVLIVDDKMSVWRNHSDNLIQINPYYFFRGFQMETSKLINAWCKYKEDWDQQSEGLVMDEELALVLSKLRLVHSLFYGEDNGDLNNKDVRQILKRVQSIDSIFEKT